MLLPGLDTDLQLNPSVSTDTPFRKLLAEFRALARGHRDKGDLFEKIIRQYLKTDPQYASRLDEVWLWNEWPLRWGGDRGIDLVARERGTGDYWAIQCKFYEPHEDIQRSHIDSFFTESGHQFTDAGGVKHSFTARLIISTTEKWGRNAEAALADQTIPTTRIGIADIDESPIDWAAFSFTNVAGLRCRGPKKVREHQVQALADISAGFDANDRGKLIMACGTGKTLTALRAAEALLPKENGRVLFLAPSISLVSQSLRSWTAEAVEPLTTLVVCSDSKVGREDEDMRAHDLAYPPTTDALKLAKAVALADTSRPLVVFCTYQSSAVIAEAQTLGLPAFDMIVCDEAHRTVSMALAGDDEPSNFALVHDNERIKGTRRLFMTATPRIYADQSKRKASEANATLYSMDDEAVFGPEFHNLPFGEAIRRDLLSDYKVVIVAVDEDEAARLTNSYNAYYVAKDEAIDMPLATKMIGAWSGLSKRHLIEIDAGGHSTEALHAKPMQRAVAFSSSIKRSQNIVRAFGRFGELYTNAHPLGDGELVPCAFDHVDGNMNMEARRKKINWLEQDTGGACHVLSNARCLSEGVDVPSLDSVIFFDARESMVDIVQSVGRVMRKAEGKEYGYIILPVCVPKKNVKEYDAYLQSDPQFKAIWRVIKAIRAHDPRLVDEQEFRRKIKVTYVDGKGASQNDKAEHDPTIELPFLDIDAFSEAIYAAIPKKLGDLEYWSEWATTIAPIAERVAVRIKNLIGTDAGKDAFGRYLEGLYENINPGISESDAVDMLAQHVITRPIFEAVFENSEFTRQNPVSRAMQHVVDVLDEHAIEKETDELSRFYAGVRERVSLAKSPKSKQDVIRHLYDSFFKNAFPKLQQKLGIVYTPVEIVDFIIRSVNDALRLHFDKSIGAKDIHIIDPFAGTGTFLVRLLQSGLVSPQELPHKYFHELHANEIVLLAYYIAAINIESAYLEAMGKHEPFEGIVLADTFQTYGAEQGTLSDGFSRENNARLRKQRKSPIRVVIGNPPYSQGQTDANENNQKQSYPELDKRVQDTYAARSSARLAKSVFNSEIKAIRWASDRIGSDGIVAFVTNGSFISSNSTDGLRKCLAEDFSHVYVFNLRGNQRTKGEISRKEGGKIFGEGSRNTVAIIIAVKTPGHDGSCRILYHDVGDYLTRSEKLGIVAEASLWHIPWVPITPNDAGDWVNHRDSRYAGFQPLGDKSSKEPSIFTLFSLGVVTNRDAWAYSFSRGALTKNISFLLANYNADVERLKALPLDTNVAKAVTYDSARIKWSDGLLKSAKSRKIIQMATASITRGAYRPFTKEWMYFNRDLNDRVYQMPRIFPTESHRNIVICVTAIGENAPFSCLVTDVVPNLHLFSSVQCFPLFTYRKDDDLGLLAQGMRPDESGFVRESAISVEALERYRSHYVDPTIEAEDIFYHVYGVLHARDYRSNYQDDLRKVLARIPYPLDFWEFSRAGRALCDLHLNYETVEPWPLEEKMSTGEQSYDVEKMRFRSKDDKSAIVYKGWLSLEGIPEEAYAYELGGRSAIEWIMERYQEKTDPDSQIRNNPNEWAPGDPRYIVDLVKRVVRVSIETTKIVNALPPALRSGS